MFMFMPAKADPATSCLVAMPPSTSQHDARQWATFIPSGRKFYPHFLSPRSPGVVLEVQFRGEGLLDFGIALAGTGRSRPCVPGFRHVLSCFVIKSYPECFVFVWSTPRCMEGS